VDVARNISEKGETDVDEEVSAAAGDHEDANGWNQNGDEDDKKRWDGGVRHGGYELGLWLYLLALILIAF